MTDSEDRMTRLPKELSSYVLSFLDLKTLLVCSVVNEVWDDITNHVSSKAWHKACLKAGIYVKKDKYKEGKDWKAFVSSTQNRTRDIGDTSITSYEFDEPITAMCCHKEKVAVAFSDSIQIWNLPGNESVAEFECEFEPLYLKFEDNSLVAASRSGVLSRWSLTSGNRLWYFSYDNGILTDFDFLPSHDIVVGSFLKNDIDSSICIIWTTTTSDVRKIVNGYLYSIDKVMLVAHPDHSVIEQKNNCCLFSLSTCEITASWVNLQNGRITATVLRTLLIPYIPDPIPRTHTVEIDKSPGGLQFDGETVYILPATPPTCSHFIWASNGEVNSRRYILNSCPILSLLGVGEKCLAYEIRREDDSELVVAVDKITQETISEFTVPRRTRLNTDDYLCLGNTSWLDSINGENNSGVVYASITDDRLGVYVKRFVL